MLLALWWVGLVWSSSECRASNAPFVRVCESNRTLQCLPDCLRYKRCSVCQLRAALNQSLPPPPLPTPLPHPHPLTHPWLQNDPAVQAALHVTAAMPYVKTWTICSGLLDYTSNEPNLPRDVYPGLVAAGLNILIYNGGCDGDPGAIWGTQPGSNGASDNIVAVPVSTVGHAREAT